MTRSDALLEARNVTLHLDGRSILTHVSADVSAGEIVTLIGPNGSGKTTLVRVLLGVIKPDSGDVFARPGLRIGYVPQRLSIEASLPLSVGRFLKFGVDRGPNRQLGHRSAVLSEVGAPDIMDARMHDLSGGELQRVMLARALLRDPDLLVLDEPVQGVDVNGQAEIYNLITRIRDKRGCGILMVSHDLHLVMASTDRVVCLNHHVCCAGKPEAVTRDPAFENIFGAEVAAQLAVYHHHHDHAHDSDGRPIPLDRDYDRGDHAHGH
jgi:zinc transport system ATP-binding protein